MIAAATLGGVALAGCTVSTPAAPSPTGVSTADSVSATTTGPAATDDPSPTTTPPPAAPTTDPPATPTTPPASAAAAPTTAPATPALMSAGSSGTQVRELQVRLRQLDWYAGTITGTYAEATTAAVRGFQDKRGLAVTGAVDQTTWSQLTARTKQPTDDELNNRLTPGPALFQQGSTGPRIRDIQARLKQIGWYSGDVTDTYGPQTTAGVRGFQDKRGLPTTGEVDQRTVDRLTAMTRTPTSDELTNAKPKPVAAAPATGLDPRCLTGRVLCISKKTRKMVWVVDGQQVMRFDVRFGSEADPTREGVFSVYRKNREWTSTIYGSAMPYSMFFSGGQAVHYSSDFARRGYAGASHGCVNVRDLGGLASLFDQVSIGDKVVVYR